MRPAVDEARIEAALGAAWRDHRRYLLADHAVARRQPCRITLLEHLRDSTGAQRGRHLQQVEQRSFGETNFTSGARDERHRREHVIDARRADDVEALVVAGRAYADAAEEARLADRALAVALAEGGAVISSGPLQALAEAAASSLDSGTVALFEAILLDAVARALAEG